MTLTQKEVIPIRYEEIYTQYKKYLVGVAYRMLGSASDAEDIVQEVFMNVSSLDWSRVTNVKAYLVRSTINRCMNLLKSNSRKREQYLGPWLPEPVIDHIGEQAERFVERKEDIRYALIVLLQELSPQERAIYIMKEILGFHYEELSAMTGKTESNCRKILSRARQKLGDLPRPSADGSREESDALVKLFIHATQTGSFTPLVNHLLREAVLITDGGGKTIAAMKPIYGADRVIALLQGIHRKGAFEGEMTMVSLNGESGIRLTRNGRTVLAVSFRLDASQQIKNIYFIMNPEKLHG